MREKFKDFNPSRYRFVALDPRVVAGSRRWNLVLIPILAFYVLGVLVVALTPPFGHASLAVHRVPVKIDKGLAPGQTRGVDVTSGELSEAGPAAAPGQSHRAALRGVQLRNLTPAIARNLGISPTLHGVVISSVDPSSAVAVADLETGDVILEVNRKPVLNVDEFNHAVAAVQGRSLLLLVKHAGSTHFIVVQS
jgi:membrane-associated protease RseP (regulator of RpoE activity)